MDDFGGVLCSVVSAGVTVGFSLSSCRFESALAFLI